MLITDEESKTQGQPVSKVSKRSSRQTAEDRALVLPSGELCPPQDPQKPKGEVGELLEGNSWQHRAEVLQVLMKPTGEDGQLPCPWTPKAYGQVSGAEQREAALAGPGHGKPPSPGAACRLPAETTPRPNQISWQGKSW